MKNKLEMTPEVKALLEEIDHKGGFKALSPDELNRIAGGAGDGSAIVDMSESHCVWYGYAVATAMALKDKGYSREAAMKEICDQAMQINVKLVNLDQTITQEKWDSFS